MILGYRQEVISAMILQDSLTFQNIRLRLNHPYLDFHRVEPADCRGRIPGKVVRVKAVDRIAQAKLKVRLWEQRLPFRLPMQRKALAEIVEAKTRREFVGAKARSNASLIGIFQENSTELFKLIDLA